MQTLATHIMRTLIAALCGALFAFATSIAYAQGIEPDAIRLALPDRNASKDAPLELLLPPLSDEDEVDPALSVAVERFVIEGSTVFDAQELGSVLSPFTGRTLTTEELLEARDAITNLYVSRGYVTSGATLPDQDLLGGTVRLRVIEGSITEIAVRGNKRFREAYFEQRLALAAEAPVHVDALEETLQRLQRDDWIDRVDARLEPGARLGESRLILVVTEAPQWRGGFEVANTRSPTVGTAALSVDAKVANAIGMRDIWALRVEATEGLRDVDARIEIPITPWDTRVRLNVRDTHTEITRKPFDVLDISADARTFGISLFHPLYRSADDEVWFEFTAERRRTHSTVLGERFCFELVRSDCGKPTVSVLRVGGQWTRKTLRDVFAFRSIASIGIDTLHATEERDHDLPDGEFVTWLGQAQWAHVMDESHWGTHIVLRADAQISDDPLLAMEKFAVGGHRTVRGYRENQSVRDNGIVVSGEARIPLVRDSLRQHQLQFVPFVDYGRAWNTGADASTDDLLGIGGGLRLTPNKGIVAELFWGGRVKDASTPSDTLQDHGVYMSLSIDAPFQF